jgi:hypothetical protein
MNRFLSFSIIFAIIFVSSACGAKKTPEQAAVSTKNAISALRQMSQSYEKKDLDAFLSNVSNDLRDRDAFAKSVGAVFAKYDTIRFNVQYAKMVVLIEQKGEIKTTFTWNAEWLMAAGASVKDGGRVTLVFEPENYKLVSIDGKNPFLAQPGETPGNK